MKSKLISAAVLAALVAAGAAVPTASIAKSSSSDQISPSAATAKQLVAAQKLMEAGDFKSALDQIHAAQAAPGKTPEDDYLVNEFLAQASIKLNDITTATTAFEAMADSPVLDKDPGKASTLYNAMIVDNISKRYQKTIGYAQKLQAIQPLEGKQIGVLTEAYYNSGDYAHVRDLAQKAIDAAKAAGQMPERATLQMLLNSQFKTGDKVAAEATLEELAADYNLGDDWERLIDIALSTKGQPVDALNLLRLGVATGASLDSSDYTLMAEIASRLGYFGDAQTAARHGGKSAGTAAKAAADQKELPGLIAAAKGQDAKHNMVLAEDVYGYGRYAEAEELARRALSKGGSADEANMLIGMSLTGQGKYPDAVSVFGQVKGNPQGMKAAHLWSLYSQRKAAPPAAATTTQAAKPPSH